jgi:putative chitinase
VSQNEEALRKVVEEFVAELLQLLTGLKKEQETTKEIVVTAPRNEDWLKPFFAHIRPSILYKRLTTSQVNGHKDIINALKKHNVPLSHAAYVLATAYHETAHRMQPVREGLNASDAWRKRNLRYYPWYGRGHVQLTWRENYVKADQKLGLGGALVANADLALDPEVSAEVLVVGSVEGWFSGDKRGRHTLARHLPNGNTATRAQFKQARRIINIMDRADQIAGYALVYQEALKKAGY